MKKTRRSLRLLITVVYMVLLMMLSLRPVSYPWPKSLWLEIINNLLHVPAYGFLTYLLLVAVMFFKGRRDPYRLVIILSILYGALIEVCQSFVPDRNPSLLDIVLNITGTLVVVLLAKRGRLGLNQKNRRLKTL